MTEPLSPGERNECELVLESMIRRGLIERPGPGRLRVTPAGEAEARRRPGDAWTPGR